MTPCFMHAASQIHVPTPGAGRCSTSRADCNVFAAPQIILISFLFPSACCTPSRRGLDTRRADLSHRTVATLPAGAVHTTQDKATRTMSRSATTLHHSVRSPSQKASSTAGGPQQPRCGRKPAGFSTRAVAPTPGLCNRRTAAAATAEQQPPHAARRGRGRHTVRSAVTLRCA